MFMVLEEKLTGRKDKREDPVERLSCSNLIEEESPARHYSPRYTGHFHNDATVFPNELFMADDDFGQDHTAPQDHFRFIHPSEKKCSWSNQSVGNAEENPDRKLSESVVIDFKFVNEVRSTSCQNRWQN